MRIFLTHIVPRDRILESGVSTACCNFSYNLISGGGFDKVYSILPSFVQDNRKFSIEKKYIEILYSPLRNTLFRRFAPIFENIILFNKIEKGSLLWLYNITSLNIFLYILLRLFKHSVKIYVIVLDYTPSFINTFFLRLINRSDGLICLANSPLFKKRNKLCLPGVVPLNAIEYPRITTVNKSFLISGVLSNNIAMLPMLLEAFSRMPDKVLHITGSVSDANLIETYLVKYPNIIYHGMVEYDNYLSILHDVSFLLSTRNPVAPENQCNFPSKIIEALLHNRIIISTIHYEQLNGIKYFDVPSDADNFIEALQIIVNKSEEELLLYANQASEVKKKFNIRVWNEAMSTIEKNSL